MSKYVFSLKSTKYGTPTGDNTMPDSGSLTALPDTVRGSVSVTESDPTLQRFFVDQKKGAIRVVQSEAGELEFTLQFYDMDYDILAAIKGGASVAAVPSTSAAKWTNGTTFDNIVKALQLETDSGQYFNFYNALLIATITGSGSRDGMFAVQMRIIPQLAADGSGDYEIEDVEIPT